MGTIHFQTMGGANTACGLGDLLEQADDTMSIYPVRVTCRTCQEILARRAAAKRMVARHAKVAREMFTPTREWSEH